MKEFQSRAQRMARKPHVCSICGGTIPPGGEYITTSEFMDGRYNRSHRHIHCDAVLYAYEQATSLEINGLWPVIEWLRETGCGDCPTRLRCEGMIGKEEMKAFSCKYALLNALPGRLYSLARKSIDFMEGGEQP